LRITAGQKNEKKLAGVTVRGRRGDQLVTVGISGW
jgi:hypothetical protein